MQGRCNAPHHIGAIAGPGEAGGSARSARAAEYSFVRTARQFQDVAGEPLLPPPCFVRSAAASCDFFAIEWNLSAFPLDVSSRKTRRRPSPAAARRGERAVAGDLYAPRLAGGDQAGVEHRHRLSPPITSSPSAMMRIASHFLARGFLSSMSDTSPADRHAPRLSGDDW